MTSPPDARTPSPPGTGEIPTHSRRIELDAYDRGDDLLVVGRLRDDRPWAAGTDQIEHLHDMELSVTVRRRDMVITEARAEMRRFPHTECTAIEEAFRGLVGLNVARGYTRAVQERFGRALGCTHLDVLARAIGPAVVQAVTSSFLRIHGAERGGVLVGESGAGWLGDTCHVWATAGPGPGLQKLALGWRPAVGVYPAPSVAELRRAAAGGAGGAGRTTRPDE